MFANCNAAVTTDTVQFFSSSTLREEKNITLATKGSSSALLLGERSLAEGFPFLFSNIHLDGYPVPCCRPYDPLEVQVLEIVMRGLNTIMAGQGAALQKKIWGSWWTSWRGVSGMPLKQQRPTTPGCISKSRSDRSREERAVYPEVHRNMRVNGHKLQREKPKFLRERNSGLG